MKKAMFSFLAFIILILGSCQESVYVEDIQEASTNTDIISQLNKVDEGIVARLQTFNDSLITESASVNGINKGDLKRGLKIACADLLGVCKGVHYGLTYGKYFGPNTAVIAASVLGPVIGAYQSYIASMDTGIRGSYDECMSSYIKMKESAIDATQYYPKRVALNLPTNKQAVQLYGAQHNLILKNLEKKCHSALSLEEALEKNILTTDEYNALTFSPVKNSFSRPVLYDSENLEFGLGELCDQIMKLYHNAIINSAISYEHIETITNKYLSEVFSTQELNEDEADMLASCMCAFVSSSEYWRIFK